MIALSNINIHLMTGFKGMGKYFTNSIRLATKKECFVDRFVQSIKTISDLNSNNLTVCLKPELHVSMDMLCIPSSQEQLCIQQRSF